MRILFALLLVALALPAAAQSLEAARPERVFDPTASPAPDPAVIRQGGDTWDEALPIPEIPFVTTGTNVGYSTNCCADSCPYEAWGPAVFYCFTPDQDVAVRVDLCGSGYDTGLYIFDEDQSLVACNVDFYYGPPCGNYVSCIEYVALTAGEFYYIVVTGMSGASGNYVLTITEWEECVLDIPAGAVAEGEPPLVDGYVDAYNGGCNSPESGAPFQDLLGDPEGHLLFAGVSGWYLNGYTQNRDTDWFTATIGAGGTITASLLAEVESYLFELAPQDCESVAVAQLATPAECIETTMQVSGEPGSPVWLWVGPTSFDPPSYPPGNEYDYLLTLDGLEPGPVTVELKTWSAVRALYR